MHRFLIASRFSLAAAVGGAALLVACATPTDGEGEGEGEGEDAVDFRLCAAVNEPLLEGIFIEPSPPTDVDVPVTLVQLRVGASEFTIDAGDVGVLTFTVANAGDIDTPVGDIVARFGRVSIGEGSATNYVRLVDDEGLWFEGGLSRTTNGTNPEGGALMTSPFSIGAVVKTCEADSDTDDVDDGGTVHDVRVAFDTGAVELPTGAFIAGQLDGIDVQVFAGRAFTTTFTIEEPIADGYDVGTYISTEVVAHAYRRGAPLE